MELAILLIALLFILVGIFYVSGSPSDLVCEMSDAQISYQDLISHLEKSGIRTYTKPGPSDGIVTIGPPTLHVANAADRARAQEIVRAYSLEAAK